MLKERMYEKKAAPAFEIDDGVKPDEVKRAIGQLGEGFEAFKAKYDGIAEEQKKRLDLMETALKRPGGALPEWKAAMDAHTKGIVAYAKTGDERELKALSVQSDPDGGFVVSTDTQGRIVKRLFDKSPMRQVSNVITTLKDAVEGVLDEDEAGADWVSETGTRAETTTPKLGVYRVPVHELHAQPKATQKLLDDADINVEEWLATKIADKFARTEGTAFVTGNGIGKPRGFLTYDVATTDDNSRANLTLQYVATGASGAFASSDPGDALINLVYTLNAGYMSGAAWQMNRLTASVVRKLKDGQGNYLWQQSLQAGHPNSLLGYPVVLNEDMPDIGADTYSIAFGNFREGYQIVDRAGIRILRDPFTAKPYVLFDTTKRVGGDVVNFDAIKLLKFGSS